MGLVRRILPNPEQNIHDFEVPRHVTWPPSANRNSSGHVTWPLRLTRPPQELLERSAQIDRPDPLGGAAEWGAAEWSAVRCWEWEVRQSFCWQDCLESSFGDGKFGV